MLVAEKLGVVVDAIKQVYIYFFLLLACHASAQTDSTFTRAPEIELLYGYYMQDGSNSAVTGGAGTEKLTYNAPTLVVHVPTSKQGTVDLKMAVDVYSSASQDNIDFNISSASRRDARTHGQLGYTHSDPKREISFGGHSSFSVESDYFSIGVGGYFSKGFNNYNNVLTVSAQAFFDDCRWGWLSGESERHLIYPEELRGTEWEEKYKRYTTTLSIQYNQLLTKRLNLGVFIDGVYQSGLLATTFHRVYYSDRSETIERLPYERVKLPIGMQLNYFPHRLLVLRGYYRFYTDSWNIQAHTIGFEPVLKINSFLSIGPFYRYYTQRGAFWFQPYGAHVAGSNFATSDYDLSSFTAYKFGIGFSWNPAAGLISFHAKANKKYGWQGLNLRSGFYNRSDGLRAFFMATSLNFGRL